MEKAYDRLEWNFIRNVLHKFNLPPQLITWIMICIESASLSLNINGNISNFWRPARGIKQGDPLSPYIFIMCINFLILKFLDGHCSGKFDGLKINKHTPPIPILCFADNCIIVCKTNTKCINFVQYTLNLFAIEACLSINWEKTKPFFSKNTPPHRSKEICQQLKLGKETLVRNTWVYPLTSIAEIFI